MCRSRPLGARKISHRRRSHGDLRTCHRDKWGNNPECTELTLCALLALFAPLAVVTGLRCRGAWWYDTDNVISYRHTGEAVPWHLTLVL
ncbi:hypothetical protein BV25DRAFT_1826476, partial [Artomyces pyxidatus]